MNMVLATVTTHPEELEWFNDMVRGDVAQHVYHNIHGSGRVVERLQDVYKFNAVVNKPDILAYVHDDVELHEGIVRTLTAEENIKFNMPEGFNVLRPKYIWSERVLAEFADPQVAIVGFGGALGIGLPEIYKTPYHISQLQRRLYMSNQTDWDVHGTRETGARDVAVVDGFFMAIRMSFLDEVKGWSWFPFNFHCYDTCMCLMALRRGYRVRMVGVECTHHGGGTSTKAAYIEWCKRNNTTPELEHSRPHEWMANEFRDLLPLWVKEGGK